MEITAVARHLLRGRIGLAELRLRGISGLHACRLGLRNSADQQGTYAFLIACVKRLAPSGPCANSGGIPDALRLRLRVCSLDNWSNAALALDHPTTVAKRGRAGWRSESPDAEAQHGGTSLLNRYKLSPHGLHSRTPLQQAADVE